MALLLGGSSCQSIPPLSQKTATPQLCAQCHSEVAEEWGDSGHSRAWTSPTFREASENYTRQECLGCHAPGSLFAGDGPPSLRPSRHEAGVDCQACHLDQDGRLVGPLGERYQGGSKPHPTRRDYFFYRTSEICGRCHLTTFAELERFSREHEGVAPRCQQCHMPARRRTRTQGGSVRTQVVTALEEPVRQRAHSFEVVPLAELGRETLEVTLKAEPPVAGRRRVALTLTNRLFHHLPTGEEGSKRVLLLILVTRDGEQAVLERRELRLARADGSDLVPGEPRLFEETVPSAAQELEIRLQREGRDGRPNLVLWQRVDPLP